MDILLQLLPEIVTLVIAVGIAVARTTPNSLDDKVARLAEDNQKAITRAIRNIARSEKSR